MHTNQKCNVNIKYWESYAERAEYFSQFCMGDGGVMIFRFLLWNWSCTTDPLLFTLKLRCASNLAALQIYSSLLVRTTILHAVEFSNYKQFSGCTFPLFRLFLKIFIFKISLCLNSLTDLTGLTHSWSQQNKGIR